MSEFDHMLAAAFAALSLILALGKAPEQPHAGMRWSFYRQAWITGTGMAGLTLLVWSASDRTLGNFGLEGWIGHTPALSFLLALGWGGVMLAGLRAIGLGMWRNTLEPIYRKLGYVMPRTRRELAGSWGAAVAAGTGEEIAYRGFLLWYLAQIVGLWPAVLITSAAFGAAHGYQRLRGVFFATLAGVVLAFAYLASSSLLLVIWMHAVYNVASFSAGRILLHRASGSNDIVEVPKVA